MKQQLINTTNVDMDQAEPGTDCSGLKSIPAYHELVLRKGYLLPALSSGFITGTTLTLIYTGKIYSLHWRQACYRECARPPTKLVLV